MAVNQLKDESTIKLIYRMVLVQQSGVLFEDGLGIMESRKLANVVASFAFLYAKSYVKTIVILIQIFIKAPQNGTL
jgi:hypothetical protein